jgi:hypothetical protein
MLCWRYRMTKADCDRCIEEYFAEPGWPEPRYGCATPWCPLADAMLKKLTELNARPTSIRLAKIRMHMRAEAIRRGGIQERLDV